MPNEDMDGQFLGGGAIDHVIQGGDVYLRADQLATLLSQTGVRMAISALTANDSASATAAHFIMIISTKLAELRSELLKREIESSWSPADFDD